METKCRSSLPCPAAERQRRPSNASRRLLQHPRSGAEMHAVRARRRPWAGGRSGASFGARSRPMAGLGHVGLAGPAGAPGGLSSPPTLDHELARTSHCYSVSVDATVPMVGTAQQWMWRPTSNPGPQRARDLAAGRVAGGSPNRRDHRRDDVVDALVCACHQGPNDLSGCPGDCALLRRLRRGIPAE
jgi:hypothetical protein